MIEMLFRAFIIFQPFLWIWMLEDDRFEFLNEDKIDHWFSVSALTAIILVGIYDINIGFYSAELLMLYSFLVWWGTWICKRAFNYSFKDAVAISFLITYLNSWYWEGVLHVWAIQENGLNMNQLFQMLHLVPAVYFLWRWEFDTRESVGYLMKGWLVSGLITFTRKARLWKHLPIVFTTLNVYQINHGLMILNRVICFVYLMKAIVRWGMPKNYAFRKRDNN